jgi:hypothetical protein
MITPHTNEGGFMNVTEVLKLKLKEQVSPKKFSRIQQNPEAMIAKACYRNPGEYWEFLEAQEAYLVGDDLYCKVICKQPKEVTGAYVQEQFTYVRYYVAHGLARKDDVMYYPVTKVNIF